MSANEVAPTDLETMKAMLTRSGVKFEETSSTTRIDASDVPRIELAMENVSGYGYSGFISVLVF